MGKTMVMVVGLALLLVSPGCKQAKDSAQVKPAAKTGRKQTAKRKDGPWRLTYKSGRLREEGSRRDGKREGRWTSYYKNGRKAVSGEFKAGLRHGKWTWWYENGRVQMTGAYIDGQEDGRWLWYRESGVKQAEGGYRLGKKHGAWVRWDWRAKKTSTRVFNRGTARSTPTSG